MELDSLQQLAQTLLNRVDYAWTFILLLTRYFVLLLVAPGLGGGATGAALRYPAAMAFAIATINAERLVGVPNHIAEMIVQVTAEILLGSAIALIPLLIVTGAQTAGHLATGTMGLNGSQLFDPSTNAALSDLSRLYSDMAIMIFLLIGGHYVVIGELAGLGQFVKPGTFVLSDAGVGAFVDQSARIFQIGCLISAPVVVALLLTNFVMGIISKAIPTVNVFIISFPLTIGIGFAISIIALPEVARFLEREFNRAPQIFAQILQ